MLNLGFNINAFVNPRTKDEYLQLLREAERMALDDDESFEVVYYAEEILEKYADKFKVTDEEIEDALAPARTLYVFEDTALTAGGWMLALGVGYQEFYEAIVTHGSAAAAIQAFILLDQDDSEDDFEDEEMEDGQL